MTPLRSTIDPRSETFRQNLAAMEVALDRLGRELARARAGGGAKYMARHLERGKLAPRERVERLLDRDSFFLEISALAGLEVDEGTPGAGLIGGIGLIHGAPCVITANDPTLQGGAVSESGVLKTNRLAEIALENRLPGVSLIESAGADLPNQARIFVPGGRGFRDLSRRSEQKIPTVCLVFGSSTAGGAYIPGMSDYTVMVRNQAQVFLAGPPLVKMATGEEVDEESLGGAEMHARQSGLCDLLAEDELDAIRLGRALIGSLSPRALKSPGPVDEPRYDPAELRGVASADVRVPFPVREVIARIVDGSRFQEFKPLYGPTLVTGFARIHGFPVGILGNDGALFAECANKGAQFIALCNQQNIPLVFLQNITGFMVGRKVEQEGIIRAGAKMIDAVSNSTVPAITVMIGASYGAGNYAMCGRAYAPRFLYTWPNHRIAVMGGEQLSGVLDLIKRQAAARTGRAVDEEQLASMKEFVRVKIDMESTAWYATARLWDDGIIDPADTRTVLGISLAVCHNAPVQGTTSWGVFRH